MTNYSETISIYTNLQFPIIYPANVSFLSHDTSFFFFFMSLANELLQQYQVPKLWQESMIAAYSTKTPFIQ